MRSAISRLMRGGFHQDCLDLFPDRDAVVDGYFVGEQPEYAREMLRDIEALRSVAPTDDGLEEALSGMDCGLLAPPDMTSWEWMRRIEDRLRRKVREWEGRA
ncbi:contact-dependent growth inhibition system immunity protein [Streptomyces sp. NPDC046465]|uniref:contact-dependent growth inhibition system immunity protein n=1 Tax=Streptomyces sp. NPDC046465 TaxID=3155810 RepID=UPI0033DCF61B